MLSDKVFRIDGGLVGRLVAWSDDHTMALVWWDGWMGDTWVKQNEMVVVQDVVVEALTMRRSSEYSTFCAAVENDNHSGQVMGHYRLMALDIAIEAGKVQ